MDPATCDHAPIRFSTDALPARDRLALFREVFARTLVGVEMEPSPDRPLHADATLRRLPMVSSLSCRMSAGLFRRPPKLVADGNDDIGLIVNMNGHIVASQYGRETELQPGEAVIFDSSDPSTTRQSDVHGVGVLVRRSALKPLVRSLDDTVMRPLRRDNEALHMLVGYLGLLHDERALSDERLREQAGDHVRQLLALALGATRDGAEFAKRGGVRAARLAAIKRDISRGLGSFDDLSVTAVAARHRVSPRYVQMLFHSQGTTFSAFVRDQRLAYARLLLTDPRFCHRSISDIALTAGFGDLSHFNRAFRRRFGATPSEIRAEAQLTKPGEPPT